MTQMLAKILHLDGCATVCFPPLLDLSTKVARIGASFIVGHRERVYAVPKRLPRNKRQKRGMAVGEAWWLHVSNVEEVWLMVLYIYYN